MLTIIRVVIALIIWAIGITIIDKNANNEFRHKFSMGAIGAICSLAIPIILIFPLFL